jgi:hypothetical protein
MAPPFTFAVRPFWHDVDDSAIHVHLSIADLVEPAVCC